MNIRDEIKYGIPPGWWNAFGEQLVKEIEAEVSTWPKESQEEFQLYAKEKFGSLRIDANIETENLGKIFDHYDELSTKTCICCGRPAVWISRRGWVSPFCDECALNTYFTKIEED